MISTTWVRGLHLLGSVLDGLCEIKAESGDKPQIKTPVQIAHNRTAVALSICCQIQTREAGVGERGGEKNLHVTFNMLTIHARPRFQWPRIAPGHLRTKSPREAEGVASNFV